MKKFLILATSLSVMLLAHNQIALGSECTKQLVAKLTLPENPEIKYEGNCPVPIGGAGGKLLQAAKCGDISAMIAVADNVLDGRGFKKDPELAAKWYRCAARKAAYAGYMLSVLYKNGIGVPQCSDLAVFFYHQAECLFRAPRAKYQVALHFLNPESPIYNHEQAVLWLKMAAKCHYIPAMNRLGDLYAQGEGVKANALEAMNWYGKAARCGSAEGMYNIGVLFYNGTHGIAKSYPSAIKWLERAARCQLVQAQYLLGHIYFKRHKYIQAYAWWTVANGQKPACCNEIAYLKIDPSYQQDYESLVSKMTPDQLSEAVHLAHEYCHCFKDEEYFCGCGPSFS